MARKTRYLQIRVAPEQKTKLQRLAAASGQDVSSYVLACALPSLRDRFESLLAALADGAEDRFALAELNDFLNALGAYEFTEATAHADLASLSAFARNYVAAMVEQSAHRVGTAAPPWAATVTPLSTPWFAAPLKSLRPHLLLAAPLPFKRRNLFVDATVGDRV